MASDCLVCFSPIETASVVCGSFSCTAKTCKACTELYIKHVADNGLIPKCPNTQCRAWYTLRELKKLSSTTLELYEKACLAEITKERGENIRKKIEEDQILEKLREERREFVHAHFPAAIALVAEIAMKTKLRRIEKQRAHKVATQLNNSHRICMNLTCTGHLDENFVCMLCETEFCDKCEKKKTASHKCNAADVESVNFISGLVKCPNCLLPIQRSEGCNNMTCASCGTNFDYASGKVGGSGSQNTRVATRQQFKLSSIHPNIGDNSMKVLLEIEAMEPVVPSTDQVNTALRCMYQTGNQKIAAKKICAAMDRYISARYAQKYYRARMAALEEDLRQGTTVDKLLVLKRELIRVLQ